MLDANFKLADSKVRGLSPQPRPFCPAGVGQLRFDRCDPAVYSDDMRLDAKQKGLTMNKAGVGLLMALLAAGCIESKTVVSVRKDGSGTIVV